MKKILVKAAMPIAPFNPNELNDLSALRVLPTNRMNTYSNPIPLTDANIGFERAVLETGGDALPGFDETDKFGRRLAGTWAALPSYRWFAEPDLGPNIGNRPLELVGIMNQQPEWSAGRKQGRLENEGFYYGGADPASYRNMQLPKGTDMEGLMFGARAAMMERGEDLENQGFRRRVFPNRIERQMKDSKHHRAIRDALLALDLPAVGNLGMWERPKIRDTFDFKQRVWEKPPFSLPPGPVETGEPMDLSWRMLKAQQTIDAYSRENVKEGFDPETQNVIIASKPGAEKISAEEQSRLHDEMLRRISELEGTENMRIMSARGRSDEWGDENSFMLSNVPDDVMPEIHSLAEEFGQESILHSEKGMAGTQFVDSSGEVTGGLEEGGFTRKRPENYTEFPTGQKYAYGDYVAASEPMTIGDVLVKYDFYYDKKRSGVQGVHYPPSRLDFTPIKGQEHPALQESGKNKRIDPTTRLTGGERPGHYVGVNIANLNPHPSMQEGQAFDQTAQMLGRNLTHEGIHSLIEDEVREAATTPQQYTNMTEWGAMQGMFPGGQDQADLASSLYASHPNTTNVVKSDVLVKERVSPEAKRHKLEYDTAYEASPERRKYRADLNRERRRRGMYGDHSGRDISHTEGGKLTVEGAHENRARHFKNQGTLRHVGVKKKANDERKANLVNVVPPQKGDDEPIIT